MDSILSIGKENMVATTPTKRADNTYSINPMSFTPNKLPMTPVGFASLVRSRENPTPTPSSPVTRLLSSVPRTPSPKRNNSSKRFGLTPSPTANSPISKTPTKKRSMRSSPLRGNALQLENQQLKNQLLELKTRNEQLLQDKEKSMSLTQKSQEDCQRIMAREIELQQQLNTLTTEKVQLATTLDETREKLQTTQTMLQTTQNQLNTHKQTSLEELTVAARRIDELQHQVQSSNKDFFFSIALAIKLSNSDSPPKNFSAQDLYERALSEEIHVSQWAVWIGARVAELRDAESMDY